MNDTLAQLSNLLIVVAIAVYVLAMLGFAADLAASTQRRSDARLAAKKRTAVGASSRSRGASAGADGGSVAVLDRDGAAGAASGETDAPSAGEQSAQGMSAGTFAMLMASAAAALHITGVVLRGVATGRVPWSNMYEFAMTGSAVVMAVFLVVISRRRDMRVLGTFIVGPMLILMLIAQRMWYVPAAHLPPSLQNSHWLVIHVLVAILATSMFTIGAVVSVLQLVQSRRDRVGAAGSAGGSSAERGDESLASAGSGAPGRIASSRAGRLGGAVMDRLPSAKELEAFAFRLHAIGFVLWTFTLIFGSIWASTAWGRYWGWDPKEVWTFVIWVVYAAYLHARATVGFRGNRAAWFALVGFACVIFNFTIVNTVINGLHSYSGLT